ncbi:MAG: tetratricopeptide repeat-containing sensor histidine kinase [Candidatus Kapaibacterium sp.]
MDGTAQEIAPVSEEDPLKLIALAKDYFARSSFDEAIATSEYILRHCHPSSDILPRIHALKLLGDIAFRRGEYLQALDTFTTALTLSQAHHLTDFEATICSSMGNIYRNLGDFTAALASQKQSLALNQALNLPRRIAGNLSNIANLYIALANFPLALEYSTEALKLARQTGNTLFEANIIGNIGVIYNELKDFPQALAHYHQAVDIYTQLGNKSMLSIFRSNIGTLYSDIGRYEEAVDYFEEAIALDEELGNKEGAARNLGNIGLMYAKKDFIGFDAAKAEEYLLPAIAVFETIGSKQYALEGHLSLAELFEITGNTARALFHLKECRTLEKEILIEDGKKQAEQFDFERKIAAERARLEEREKVVSELQLLNASLEEANREKNEVIGIVAHDLKNPITGIILTTETMERFSDRLSPEERSRQIAHIRAAAERMKAIVMNLLDIQLMESGRFRVAIGEIPLDSILDACLAEFSSRAADKNITIRVRKPALPVTVLADSHALHEVLDNLLSNALKFSPRDSTVVITVTGEHHRVRIGVQDQGPGLTDEDKTKLFGKFMRLSARPTAGEDSTGLGLSIVKKLVEAMSGRIWCESEYGAGATFICEVESV